MAHARGELRRITLLFDSQRPWGGVRPNGSEMRRGAGRPAHSGRGDAAFEDPCAADRPRHWCMSEPRRRVEPPSDRSSLAELAASSGAYIPPGQARGAFAHRSARPRRYAGAAGGAVSDAAQLLEARRARCGVGRGGTASSLRVSPLLPLGLSTPVPLPPLPLSPLSSLHASSCHVVAVWVGGAPRACPRAAFFALRASKVVHGHRASRDRSLRIVGGTIAVFLWKPVGVSSGVLHLEVDRGVFNCWPEVQSQESFGTKRAR